MYLLPAPRPTGAPDAPREEFRNGFLAAAYTAQDVADFLAKDGARVFQRSWGQTIWSALWSMIGWSTPKYSNQNLKRLMETYAGDEWLSDLVKVIMVSTATDLELRVVSRHSQSHIETANTSRCRVVLLPYVTFAAFLRIHQLSLRPPLICFV